MRLPVLLTLHLLTSSLALAAPPTVTASPERVVLGVDARVVLEVRVPEGSGPVHAVASSGSFAQATVEGGPVRTFEWTPPDVRYPLSAVFLFTVVGPGQAPPEVARLALPLLGRTTLDINTRPRAEVVVEIANTRFGPVKSNARGRAQVPVEVPPGVTSARVLATHGTQQTDRTVPLEPPPHRPLAALLTPDPMSADVGGWLVVAGAEDAPPQVDLLNVQGALVEPMADAPGTFRVRPVAESTRVSVEVRRKDAPDAASASVEVRAPVPVVVEPEKPAPPVLAERGSFGVHLLAGNSFAEGANSGLMLALGASYRLPVWQGRIAAELEASFRQASLDTPDELGTVRSRILAGPVLASARITTFELGAFALYGRAGAGVIPFELSISRDAQGGYAERSLGFMAFLAAQGAYRFGAWSALLELRGATGSVSSASLKTPAQLGGIAVTLGMRYVP
jgi:hypothetical protein